jgi:hypothetical protein
MHAALWIAGGLLGGSLAATLVPRPKPSARPTNEHAEFVPAGGKLAVRARLKSAPEPVPGPLHHLVEALANYRLSHEVSSYFASPTGATPTPVRVQLTHPTTCADLQRHNPYELDFAAQPAPSALSLWRTGTQLSAVTVTALVATYFADALQGLQAGRSSQQPLAAKQPSDYLPPQTRPIQPAVQGRWLLASLATPSGHPFRTSVVATGYIAGTSIPPAANVTATPHGNTPTPHANTFSGAYPTPAGFKP